MRFPLFWHFLALLIIPFLIILAIAGLISAGPIQPFIKQEYIPIHINRVLSLRLYYVYGFEEIHKWSQPV